MCTRIVYETGTGAFITGRGMDWSDPTAPFQIFSFPRGLERKGGPVDNAIAWRSQYGSVTCSMYDASTTDGMNERGLVANVLYLAEADYGDYMDPIPLRDLKAAPEPFIFEMAADEERDRHVED